MDGAFTSSGQGREGQPAHVLACGSADGLDLQVLEFPDGTLAIECDGHVPDPFRWPAGQMERCMRAYLNLLHSSGRC